MDELVEIFCERTIADDYLMIFFNGLNVTQFKAHQVKLVRVALNLTPQDIDQPRSLSKQLQQSHRHLFEMGLNETHFDRVVEHMTSALRDLDVRPRYIDEIRSKVLLPYREIFVKHDAPKVCFTHG